MESNKSNNLKNSKIIKRHSKKVSINVYDPSQIFSESIIKSLLDKIITMSVIKSHSIKIDNKMGEYCFNYLEDIISPLFESSFINHTIYPEKKNESISWKTKTPLTDTWVEIPEPDFFEYDRCEGSVIKYVEIPKDDSLNKSIKKGRKPSSLLKNKNGIKKIEENANENNTKNFVKKINEKKETYLNKKTESNKNIDFINEKTEKIENEQNNKDQKDNNQNNDNLDNNGTSVKKNRKLEPLDLPSYDIPNIIEEYDHDKYNPKNVDYLRKVMAEEIMKQMLEKEKKKKLAQKPVFVKVNTEKNTKPFDPSRLTFDPNGKIIKIKEYSNDKLLGDFLLTKLTIKDKRRRVPSIVPSSEKKSKNLKLKLPSPLNDVDVEELIIKNPLDKDIYQSNLYKRLQTDEKIIPAGNNFNLILPGLGVVASDDKQVKEGPKEFSKHFKKYSINDYQNILNDYLPNLNKTMLQEKVGNKKLSTKKSNFSPIKNKSNYTDNNINNTNPLIDNNINNSFEEDNKKFYEVKKSMDYKNTTFNNSSNHNSLNQISDNNPLLTSYKNNNMQSSNLNSFRNNNSINFENTITMKEGLKTSLKIELDSLRDLSENNPNFTVRKRGGETDRNNENILAKQLFHRKNITNQSLNSSDKHKNIFLDFNRSILLNRRWGEANLNNISGRKGKVIFSKHQTRRQVEMELGSGFLHGIKVKLPRERKVDLNI